MRHKISMLIDKENPR